MAVTPAGSLSLPMASLRSTLAKCAAFQSRVGAANAAAALPSIKYGPVVNAAGVTLHRPFACLYFAVAGANQVADGVAIELHAGGGIILRFEDNAHYNEADEDNDPSDEDSYLDFMNWVGETLDELKELAGYDDNFPMARYEMLLAPDRTERTKRTRDSSNDYWVCVVQIHFGNDLEYR